MSNNDNQAREGALMALLEQTQAICGEFYDNAVTFRDLEGMLDRALARLRSTPPAAEPEPSRFETCVKCRIELMDSAMECDEHGPPAAPATDAEPVDGRHHFSPDTDNSKHGHCAHCGQPILWIEAGEYCAANVPPSAAQLAASEAKGRASAQTRIAALRAALEAVAWIKCTYCRGTNHASAAVRADDAAAKEAE